MILGGEAIKISYISVPNQCNLIPYPIVGSRRSFKNIIVNFGRVAASHHLVPRRAEHQATLRSRDIPIVIEYLHLSFGSMPPTVEKAASRIL